MRDLYPSKRELEHPVIRDVASFFNSRRNVSEGEGVGGIEYKFGVLTEKLMNCHFDQKELKSFVEEELRELRTFVVKEISRIEKRIDDISAKVRSSPQHEDRVHYFDVDTRVDKTGDDDSLESRLKALFFISFLC